MCNVSTGDWVFPTAGSLVGDDHLLLSFSGRIRRVVDYRSDFSEAILQGPSNLFMVRTDSVELRTMTQAGADEVMRSLRGYLAGRKFGV